jgi:hypothetical protein
MAGRLSVDVGSDLLEQLLQIRAIARTLAKIAPTFQRELIKLE